MDISNRVDQGHHYVSLNGKFTFDDHEKFRGIIDVMNDNETQSMTLDVSNLEFVDSAALGLFLLLNDVSKKHNKNLSLKNLNGQVKKMFEMAKFSELFTVQ